MSTDRSARDETRSEERREKKTTGRRDGKDGAESRTPHRRGSVILFRILIVLLSAASAVAVVRLLLLLVPIREIVIADDSYYTDEELLDALALDVGDRMYGFSGGKTEKRVLKECTLLSSVRLKKSLGGILTVSVEEKKSDFYVNVSGTYCLLGREDFCVLLQCATSDRLREYGFFEISLPDVRVAFLSDELEYGSEKENEYVQILLDAIDASPLAERVTGIRAAERFNLSIIVDGKYDVTLGDVEDVKDKLDYFPVMEQSDQSEIFRSGSHAVVDLSVLSAPTVRAVDEIDQTISRE